MNRVNLLMCFVCLWLLAACSQESAQPDATNGATVAVTREIRVQLLPMQEVTTAGTRGTLNKEASNKETARGTGAEKRESLHMSYSKDAATRAEELTPEESTLKNAYIVQFNGTTPTSTAAFVSGDVKSQLSSGTAITCNFVMTAGMKNRVYVVANVATAPTKGMTLAAFEAPVTYTVGSGIPATGLPMSAMQDAGVGDQFDLFQLRSLLARLKFTTTSGATLKLKGVPSGYSFYKQSAGKGAVRPSGMTYNNSGVTLTSGATYYVPENLSGRNDLLIKHVTRALGMAPANALYVEITNSGTVYNLLLGDGNANDFNFVGGYAYSINATIYGTDAYDLRVGNPAGLSSITDLNGDGQTANCYIATAANAWYMFSNTVMGNGATTPVPTNLNSNSVAAPIIPKPLNPVDADVLWETLNTTTSPAKGDVVTANLYFLKDRILFKAGAKEGNAVVAARDAQNNIVWSWHIWRTNSIPASQPLAAITGFAATGELAIMDRNLGALSATAQNNLSTGLHYQWGRKDPMPAYAGFTSPNDVVMATQPTGIPVIPGSSAQYTVEQSIQQPTTFFKYSDDRNDNLWGTPLTVISGGYTTNKGSKSIYDPCPVGWRVPPGYAFANASTSNGGTFNLGYSFGSGFLTGGSSWFPAVGYRSIDNGLLDNVGGGGRYWTSTPNVNDPTSGSRLIFFSGAVDPANGIIRTLGCNCKCVKELL